MASSSHRRSLLCPQQRQSLLLQLPPENAPVSRRSPAWLFLMWMTCRSVSPSASGMPCVERSHRRRSYALVPGPRLCELPPIVHFPCHTRNNISDSGDASACPLSALLDRITAKDVAVATSETVLLWKMPPHAVPRHAVPRLVNVTRMTSQGIAGNGLPRLQTSTLDTACGVIVGSRAIYNNLSPGKIELQPSSTLLTFISSVTPQSRAASPEEFITVQEQHRSFAAQGESAAAATQSDVKCSFGAFVMISAWIVAEMDGMK